MRGGGIPADRGAFAFPNTKVDLNLLPPTEAEKRARRIRQLVAELRLYHHYEAAALLESLQREKEAFTDLKKGG